MGKLEQQFRGLVIKSMFTPVLKKFRDDPIGKSTENLLKEIKNRTAEILIPEVTVWISLLEEEVELRKNTIILIQDIINLDWEKEETELQYESMRKCLDDMNKRNDELTVIIEESIK